MSLVRRWGWCWVALMLAGCEDPDPVQSDGEASGPLEEVDRILNEVGGELASDPAAVVGGEGDGGGEAVQVNPVAPVAEAVPNEPGFVISPFNGRKIDVRGVPSGTLVADPHFPAADKKYFVVPEPVKLPSSADGEDAEPAADEPKV